MHGRSCSSLLAVLLLSLCSPPALWGQTTTISARGKPPGQFGGLGSGKSSPPGSAPTFSQLARTAGTIFAGTVTRIEPGPAAGGSAVPTVAITFHVERPLRGAVPGGSLTILEWLGLWSSGQRYAVGEHVLLFLYPPSKLGLTSVVGGALGQFHLDSAGGILPSEWQFAAFQADPVFAGRSAGRSRIGFNDFARALRWALREQAE
jgi:hypothetical protein